MIGEDWSNNSSKGNEKEREEKDIENRIEKDNFVKVKALTIWKNLNWLPFIKVQPCIYTNICNQCV